MKLLITQNRHRLKYVWCFVIKSKDIQISPVPILVAIINALIYTERILLVKCLHINESYRNEGVRFLNLYLVVSIQTDLSIHLK